MDRRQQNQQKCLDAVRDPVKVAAEGPESWDEQWNKESVAIGLSLPRCGAWGGLFHSRCFFPLLSYVLLMADRAARVPGKNLTGLHLHSVTGDEEAVGLVFGT